MRVRRKRGESGSSIVEVALMSPWIFFLFVGLFDWGFYSFAAICTQNAARSVAIAAAQPGSGSTGTPCDTALGELRMLPNVGYAPSSSAVCAVVAGAPAVTQVIPINICIATLNGTASSPCGGLGGASNIKCADCNLPVLPGKTAPSSVLAAVTYQTIPLVPIPLILTGQLTLTRGAEVRITSP
jgi:hypothetical protein